MTVVSTAPRIAPVTNAPVLFEPPLWCCFGGAGGCCGGRCEAKAGAAITEIRTDVVMSFFDLFHIFIVVILNHSQITRINELYCFWKLIYNLNMEIL